MTGREQGIDSFLYLGLDVDQAMCVPVQNDVKNKKLIVWTKLKNGLYGWRMIRTRLATKDDLKLIPGAGTPTSTLGQTKWVPAKMGMSNISNIKTGIRNENKKRKYAFDGGGHSILGKKSMSFEESKEHKNETLVLCLVWLCKPLIWRSDQDKKLSKYIFYQDIFKIF